MKQQETRRGTWPGTSSSGWFWPSTARSLEFILPQQAKMPFMERFNAFTDRCFGTRLNTSGAQIQLPRKVPIRIEPKTFFANERTFLAWVGMATTLGGVSTALVGFATEEQDKGGHRGPITPRTTQLITVLLLPLAILMILYGLIMYFARVEYLRKKQLGFFTDWVGPAVACVLVMASLLTIMIVAFLDVFFYQYPES